MLGPQVATNDLPTGRRESEPLPAEVIGGQRLVNLALQVATRATGHARDDAEQAQLPRVPGLGADEVRVVVASAVDKGNNMVDVEHDRRRTLAAIRAAETIPRQHAEALPFADGRPRRSHAAEAPPSGHSMSPPTCTVCPRTRAPHAMHFASRTGQRENAPRCSPLGTPHTGHGRAISTGSGSVGSGPSAPPSVTRRS